MSGRACLFSLYWQEKVILSHLEPNLKIGILKIPQTPVPDKGQKISYQISL
jgi:hypothetical protein